MSERTQPVADRDVATEIAVAHLSAELESYEQTNQSTHAYLDMRLAELRAEIESDGPPSEMTFDETVFALEELESLLLQIDSLYKMDHPRLQERR